MQWFRSLSIVEDLDAEREEEPLRGKTLPIEDLRAKVMGVERYVLHFPAVCIRSNDSWQIYVLN